MDRTQDPNWTKGTSKFLSLVLRHEPERLGLQLESGGWVSVDQLLAAMAQANRRITRQELDHIVHTNDKQRFSFNDGGTSIRANQGHSTEVDLQLQPQTPPAILYHGTHPRALESIHRQGLQKMERHAVHLSADKETAAKVGARRGKPILLQIDAQAMSAEGHTFFLSANGVWLTDHVPAKHIKTLT